MPNLSSTRRYSSFVFDELGLRQLERILKSLAAGNVNYQIYLNSSAIPKLKQYNYSEILDVPNSAKQRVTKIDANVQDASNTLFCIQIVNHRYKRTWRSFGSLPYIEFSPSLESWPDESRLEIEEWSKELRAVYGIYDSIYLNILIIALLFLIYVLTHLPPNHDTFLLGVFFLAGRETGIFSIGWGVKRYELQKSFRNVLALGVLLTIAIATFTNLAPQLYYMFLSTK